MIGHVALALVLFGAAVAGAQTYPSRTVRMVVGFPPGGGTDVMARIVAPKMVEAWGQQVVIDNRPGATGMIGAELVARSAPDGYTLLMGHVATNAVAPSLFSKVPFDPIKDFAPITLVASVPHLIVVHPSLPVKSVKELIAMAKAQPGKLVFPSAGNGSTPHLAGEIFKMMAGVDLLHVPYKGSGQSVQDLLGGQVMLAFDTTPTVAHFAKQGRLRALAITSAKRLGSMPDVPTVQEAGVPGYTFITWYGMFAPAGTPRDIVVKLHAEIARIRKLPDVRERLITNIGADDFETASPDEFAALLKADIAKYAKVVKALGLRID